jgi:GTPase SAR1 family protein
MSLALRLVLFGRNDAGKSSLLGALMQAAQTQVHLLDGRLTDLSGGLTELQKRLYEQGPGDTSEEVVPYPIRFQPERGGKKIIDAVLIDCDGQAVNRLLEGRHLLTGDDPVGPLAQAIMAADALILVVDAAAVPAQVDADFGQFEHFLRLLEQSRGRQIEVTGQPVLLALTKCDLLVHGDETKATVADWLNRIDDRQRRVGERFGEFLARAWRKDALPFGQIHLESVRATAIKQPALADRPAQPQEPYGVAELFRDALVDAQVYRSRRKQSNRGLFRTVAASAGLVTLMFALLAGLVGLAVNSHEPGPLEQEVTRYLKDGPSYSRVPEQIADLKEWASDPVFASLPPARQQQVRDRLDELTAYEDHENKLNAITDPLQARTVAEVSDIANRLKQLRIPPAYAEKWHGTADYQTQITWEEDALALRAASVQARDWYLKLAKDGKQVLDNAAASDLPGRARQVLERADQPPFPVNHPTQPLPGSKRATYATVFGMQSTADARNQWDEIKKQLQPIAAVRTGGE